jgi:hypothetical protein
VEAVPQGYVMVLKRNYFAIAGVITGIIFILGIVVGVQLDLMKSDGIQERYRQTELDWLDVQLKSDYYKFSPDSVDYCDLMIKSNMDFADTVYARGLEIQRYEEQSKILTGLREDKIEYALLKFQFWLDAIKLRDSCDADYQTVIYFYKDSPTGFEEVYQNAQSNVLLEVKDKLGQEIILVPLPIDLDIEVIDLLVEQFNIKETPTVVINEEIVLAGVVSQQKVIQELNSESIKTVA